MQLLVDYERQFMPGLRIRAVYTVEFNGCETPECVTDLCDVELILRGMLRNGKPDWYSLAPEDSEAIKQWLFDALDADPSYHEELMAAATVTLDQRKVEDWT